MGGLMSAPLEKMSEQQKGMVSDELVLVVKHFGSWWVVITISTAKPKSTGVRPCCNYVLGLLAIRVLDRLCEWHKKKLCRVNWMDMQRKWTRAFNTFQLERQIQMQNYMRERQVAMGLARQRELFYNWYSPFYGLVVLGCTLGYVLF